MQGTTCTRSKPVHGAGPVRQADPEGGVPRRAEAPHSGATRRRRRAAAAGGGTHVWSWGMVGRGGCDRGAGRNARARPRAVSLREKGWLGRVSCPICRASVYNVYTANTRACVCPSPAYSSSDSQPGRPTRGGSDRDGRERPAADGRAGPFRPERTPFFPSLSSLRDSFHYGKNDIDLRPEGCYYCSGFYS